MVTMGLSLGEGFFLPEIFFRMCVSAAPYWILGIALGSAVTQILSVEKIKKSRFLVGVPGIVVGALFGVLSPIGLYGAVPISCSFAAAGVPASTIFAFLISTPLINPNYFIFTAGVFGYPMAFARLFSALLLGVTGGCIIWSLGRFKRESVLNVDSLARARNGHARGTLLPESLRKKGSFSGFCREFIHYIRFSAPYFLIAVVLAALIQAFVPVYAVEKVLGLQNPFSVIIASALSIPLYLCGGNTIPFVHELVNSGMSKGAALAFFIAGPAMKISNITFLSSLLGVRGVTFFLTITLAASIAFGYWYGLTKF
jgi:uncharacterized membrane protein YraQ (UPF0718 family)